MIKTVKISFILFFLLIASSGIYSSQTDFINSLLEKKAATFSDCIMSFCYLKNIDPSGDFDANLGQLKKIIPIMPKNISKDKALTIGDFSLLAAQYLDLKTVLLYIGSKSPRYAVRELIEINILPFNTSEWEKVSGLELIKLMQRIYTYVEKK
jgi:hypothetical protein